MGPFSVDFMTEKTNPNEEKYCDTIGFTVYSEQYLQLK